MLLAHALASVGMSLPWPLLLVLVWEHTHSDLWLGMTGAARMAPYVLLSWAAGRLADARQRDRLVSLTIGLRAVALTVAALAVATGWLLPLAVVAAAAAVAVATPAYPALAAAMPGAAGPGTGRATELLVTIEVGAFVVGPALGGLLLADPARPLVFPVALGLVVAAGAMLRGVCLPAPRVTAGSALPTRLGRVVRRPEVAVVMAVMAAVNALVALVAIALLPVAEQVWRAGPSAYGVATGVLGFGALAGPALTRLGRGERARMARGLGLLAVALLLVVPMSAPAWALAPLALAGAAAVQVEAAATARLQQVVPDQVRASVLGATDTAMVAAALVGSLAGPALAHLLGGRLLLVLVAALAGATGLALGAGMAAGMGAGAAAGVAVDGRPGAGAAGGDGVPVQRTPPRPSAGRRVGRLEQSREPTAG
ncbi:MAG: MFS transporter [Nocardioides sp.]